MSTLGAKSGQQRKLLRYMLDDYDSSKPSMVLKPLSPCNLSHTHHCLEARRRYEVPTSYPPTTSCIWILPNRFANSVAILAVRLDQPGKFDIILLAGESEPRLARSSHDTANLRP
jgi:hypothetical protein